MTEKEYWAEVKELAAYILEEASDRDEDVQDVLHEVIDGHQWVIYTHQNREVLLHCSNPDAYAEIGEVPVLESGTLNWAAMAYLALAEDVQEAISCLEKEAA